ncbi:alcohol acetyltransferase, partial [Colletotrichum asianum]
GPLEKYLVHQHEVGYYNVAVLSAEYSFPRTTPGFRSRDVLGLVYSALGRTLKCHPILGVTLKDEDSPQPSFSRIDRIDLRRVVEVKISRSASNTAALIQAEHQRKLARRHDVPLWRCLLVLPTDKIDHSLATSFILALVCHHVVGDGISMISFHKTFYRCFNQLLSLAEIYPYGERFLTGNEVVAVPKLPLVPYLEESMTFPMSRLYILRLLFKALVYSPIDPLEWVGPPIGNERPPFSNTRYFYLPQQDTRNLLRQCRQNRTSITALLTVLVSNGLSVLYKPRTRFTASVPFSLRKFSKHGEYDMGCFTSIAEPRFSADASPPPGYIPCQSTANSPGAGDDRSPCTGDSKIWASAHMCKHFLQQRSASTSNLTNGLIKFRKDHRKGLLDLRGAPRRHAFTLTNLGVVDSETSQIDGRAAGSRASVDKFVLSAGSATNGAPYTICAISQAGGYMGITVNWEAGVVEDESAEWLLAFLNKELQRLSAQVKYTESSKL